MKNILLTSHPKMIAIGVYWNEIDWLEASLAYMDYWKPSKVCILEGCYDPHYTPRHSTDGTREYLEKEFKGNVLDNVTKSDFASNQSLGLNRALKHVDAKENEWVMIFTADQYFFKKDIDLIKSEMKDCDYFSFKSYTFGLDLTKCSKSDENMSTAIPSRLLENSYYKGRTNLTLNGIPYPSIKGIRNKKLDVINYHYFGIRNKERWNQKKKIGDRKGDIEKLKYECSYKGKHPEFTIPILEKCGIKTFTGTSC